MARPRRAHSEEPIRITTAAAGRNQDIAARQKRYLEWMAFRVACFIGAVFTGMAHINWAWPILVVAALVVPYVAVVAANAAHTRGEEFTLMDSPYGRPELRGGKQWREQQREEQARDEAQRAQQERGQDRP